MPLKEGGKHSRASGADEKRVTVARDVINDELGGPGVSGMLRRIFWWDAYVVVDTICVPA